jgi:conjugal transfer pilus assembly protein TraD
MLLRTFEMPWRPVFEARSAVVWMLAVVLMSRSWYNSTFPDRPFYYLATAAFIFCLWNMWEAGKIYRLKWALAGKGISFISDDELISKITMEDGSESRHLWMGKGFDWSPTHTQRLYEIKRGNPSTLYPPKPIMKLMEYWSGEPVGANSPEYIGAPWIHGLDGGETDIYMPIQNWIGNTLVIGTNRCGKTRAIELWIEQAIALGYTVILIDPKGDKELKKSMRQACLKVGRLDDFVLFQLAFPGESVRIDPLKNFTNLSDLASRISALMPGEGAGSSFRDFAWSVLNAIILGQDAVGEKSTLVSIRSYVENGIADLLTRVIIAYFDDNLEENWEVDVEVFVRALKQPKGNKSLDTGDLLIRQSLNAMLMYYQKILVPRRYNSEAVQALAGIYTHDAAHYSKMISNLIPILGKLTTGELGALLSPDPRDISDTRPITDMAGLIRSNSVVLIGLDSLANKEVSSAVGSIILSDLTSDAASIYNYGTSDKKIFLMVDEVAEVANEPYVQMLNKSAGAGFINVACIQTIPDLEARLESRSKAYQALGNFNNIVCMRVLDPDTQKFVTTTLGETYVISGQTIKGTTSSTEKNIVHFSGSVQERITESQEATIPADILAQMPNWQYIAKISGGRYVKGRLPIIQHEEEGGFA